MKEITFKGEPVAIKGNEIKAGDIAPEFTLTGNDMEPVRLSDYKGLVKILSVFPSIDTKVCAAQTRRFNQEASKLHDEIAVLCISKDLPFAQNRFCAAEGLDKVVTLSDFKNNEFGEKYGFLLEELGLLTRGIVVIDKDDVVQYVEYVSEVAEEPDYGKAIEEAKNALHAAHSDLTTKLLAIGLSDTQATQVVGTVKNHLERRMPPFMKNHLSAILAGEKIEMSDILATQSETFVEEVKLAAGSLAEKTEAASGKILDTVKHSFDAVADLFSKTRK
jgi:thiol peroxidase